MGRVRVGHAGLQHSGGQAPARADQGAGVVSIPEAKRGQGRQRSGHWWRIASACVFVDTAIMRGVVTDTSIMYGYRITHLNQ